MAQIGQDRCYIPLCNCEERPTSKGDTSCKLQGVATLGSLLYLAKGRMIFSGMLFSSHSVKEPEIKDKKSSLRITIPMMKQGRNSDGRDPELMWRP